MELSKILFLDIETVPQCEYFGELSDEMQHCWTEKFVQLQKRMPDKYADLSVEQAFEKTAGIFSEFGKIICIAVGFIHNKNGIKSMRITSFANDDEKQLLADFRNLLVKTCKSSDDTLCGHNIKEFDIPYLCRRMIINEIALPRILNIAGKKPWEVQFFDTLELWKFGDVKNYTSLKLLAAILGIPTPKDDIDGSQVREVYYKERNIERIAAYCRKDVIATTQIFLRLNGFETIDSDSIEIV